MNGGLNPLRSVFSNGVTLLTKQTRKTPAVTFSLALRCGSIADPLDAPGAAHLLARVIDRGTATRSAIAGTSAAISASDTGGSFCKVSLEASSSALVTRSMTG